MLLGMIITSVLYRMTLVVSSLHLYGRSELKGYKTLISGLILQRFGQVNGRDIFLTNQICYRSG